MKVHVETGLEHIPNMRVWVQFSGIPLVGFFKPSAAWNYMLLLGTPCPMSSLPYQVAPLTSISTILLTCREIEFELWVMKGSLVFPGADVEVSRGSLGFVLWLHISTLFLLERNNFSPYFLPDQKRSRISPCARNTKRNALIYTVWTAKCPLALCARSSGHTRIARWLPSLTCSRDRR